MKAYDVAFSLLSEDEGVATEIRSRLPPHVSSFLYSSAQRELVADGDGLNAFPTIFRSARLCVVLFRERWGKTPWTRLEEQTIADRYMGEGTSCLLMIRLDGDSALPAWIPRQMIWVDYQAEGAAKAADYIAARLERHDHPDLLITKRTFDRQPVPLTRYEAQIHRTGVVGMSIEPRTCDACGTVVQFRPMATINLPPYQGLPASTETVCPTCARERGSPVHLTAGLTEEALYARRNPTFRDHVRGRFRHVVLGSLTADEDLRGRGITNVGAVFAGPWIELHISLTSRPDIKVALSVDEMQQARAQYDPELIAFAKAKVQEALNDNA